MLVGLAALAILATVVMQCQVAILRAQAMARDIEESCCLASRLAGETWVGTRPDLLGKEADDLADWKLDLRIESTVRGTGTVYWCRWTLAPAGRPSLVTEVCLRAPPIESYAGSLKSGGLRSLIQTMPGLQK